MNMFQYIAIKQAKRLNISIKTCILIFIHFNSRKCNICDQYYQELDAHSEFEKAKLTEVYDFVVHLCAPALRWFDWRLVVILLDDLHIAITVFPDS